jgi:hypothetical protein
MSKAALDGVQLEVVGPVPLGVAKDPLLCQLEEDGSLVLVYNNGGKTTFCTFCRDGKNKYNGMVGTHAVSRVGNERHSPNAVSPFVADPDPIPFISHVFVFCTPRSSCSLEYAFKFEFGPSDRCEMVMQCRVRVPRPFQKSISAITRGGQRPPSSPSDRVFSFVGQCKQVL